MAQNNQPLVVRSKLLPDNSAAEFVELRTDKFFGPEFSRPNGIEYSPDVDMFIAQDVASSLKSVRMKKFSKPDLLISYSTPANPRLQVGEVLPGFAGQGQMQRV